MKLKCFPFSNNNYNFCFDTFYIDDVCENIVVALKNTALTSQGPVQGTYQPSVKINGDQSWISNDNGKVIWYNPEKYIWLIGSEENIGGEIGSFYAPRIPGSGPDNDKIVWSYRLNGWTTDNEKDVSVACKGKKSQIRKTAMVENVKI